MPVIDGYAISRFVSRTAGAETWEAVQISLDRPVLLVVPSQAVATTEAQASAFETRARAYARLRGESFVPVIDIGRTTAGNPYAVLEPLGGRPLADILAQAGTIPEDRAIAIALSVAKACNEAWRQSAVVFRSISPQTVVLSGRDSVKFAAFESLWFSERTADSMMLDMGKTIGEPGYMAPEQESRSAALDFRADIYALGVMLCKAVTGLTPAEGGEESLSPHLSAIVAQFTDSAPNARPASWADAIDALRANAAEAVPRDLASHSLKIHTNASAPRVRLPNKGGSNSAPATELPAKPHRKHSSPAAKFFRFVAFLAIVGGVAYWRVRSLEKADSSGNSWDDSSATEQASVAEAGNTATVASQAGKPYGQQPSQAQSQQGGASTGSSGWKGGQGQQTQRAPLPAYDPVKASRDAMFRRISYTVRYRPYPDCIREARNAIRDTGKRTQALEKNCRALWSLVNEMPPWEDLAGFGLSGSSRERTLEVGDRKISIRNPTGYSRPNLICQVKTEDSEWTDRTVPLNKLSTKEMYAIISALPVDKSDKALVSRALLTLREGRGDDFKKFVAQYDVKPLKPLVDILGR